MADTTYMVGATSKIVTVEAIVISTGLPYAGGAWNTATISATYTRDTGTPVTITLETATAGTYTASGFVHRGKGTYEIGAPDAAFAAPAVDGVSFAVDGIADVLFRGCRVELTSGDPRAAALTTAQIIAAEKAELNTYVRPTTTGVLTLGTTDYTATIVDGVITALVPV